MRCRWNESANDRDARACARRVVTARRRGSVLILVVAVLALLVVIGTVYILSARAGHHSAMAMSSAVNLDWAQQAVDEHVRQTISNSLYDAKGILGGYS